MRMISPWRIELRGECVASIEERTPKHVIQASNAWRRNDEAAEKLAVYLDNGPHSLLLV